MLDPSPADGSLQKSRQIGRHVFGIPNLGQELIMIWQCGQVSIDLAFKVLTEGPPILQADRVLQGKTNFCKTIVRNQSPNIRI